VPPGNQPLEGADHLLAGDEPAVDLGVVVCDAIVA
jgi:hypothetical protein